MINKSEGKRGGEGRKERSRGREGGREGGCGASEKRLLGATGRPVMHATKDMEEW